jgi:acyl carrier protein
MNERQELIDLFRKIVSEVTEKPFPEVPPETPIGELGIDSILIAEIVARTEDSLGIEVQAERWMRVRTLDEFLGVIEEARRLKVSR